MGNEKENNGKLFGLPEWLAVTILFYAGWGLIELGKYMRSL